MKKILLVLCSFAFFLAAFADRPKNIILFIGDGMSTPQRMIAEEFSRFINKKELKMNHLEHQATTRTCSANSIITDSAAAATAIACGVKTNNGSVGVDPKRNKVYSSAVSAAQSGRRVGIVTSVTINHATPAGFYGHRKSRSDGYGLGLDLVASGFDYFAGGVVTKHDDEKHPEYKGDIYDLAAKAGYRVIRDDPDAFRALKPGSGKVIFSVDRISRSSLPFSIDSDVFKTVPSLAELTAKGIELLDNEKGFFMMVEGGRIDWAGHSNDAAANLHDVLALNEAVLVALDFAEKNKDTLVIVTGDHETGGMTMGFASTGSKIYFDRLAKQKCSTNQFSKDLAAMNPRPDSIDDLKPVVSEKYGLVFGDKDDPMFVSKADLELLENAFKKDIKAKDYAFEKFCSAVNGVFSRKCGIGWTSGSHTALPVLTTATGPGSEKIAGFLDNTDLSKIVKSLLERD